MEGDETIAPPGAGGGPGPRAQVVGPYAILGELGRGGMGIVYAAQHVELGRRVAIKLLFQEQADPRTVQRFEVEARALAQVRHPGIVSIHEAGLDRGRPYLVMDLVDGESLDDRIKRGGPLEPEAAAAMIEALAEALEHVHAQGLVHRDLKPANVLLDEAGRAVITDFGLARQLGDERERLTRTGQTLGTPAYMPPEQVDGADVDARADVYSLGATLYAALTGRPPFSGSTAINILTAVLTRPPDPIRQPGVSSDLATVCLKCLEKLPEDRYASASAFAADLRRARRGEPILGRRPWRLGRSALGLGASVLVLVMLVAVALTRPPVEDAEPGQSPSVGSTARTSPRTAPRRDPHREGTARWNLIEPMSEGGEKVRLTREWLARFGSDHPAAGAVRGWLALRAPQSTWSGSEATEACFLSGSRAVTAGAEVQVWALGPPAVKMPSLKYRGGYRLSAAGPNAFLVHSGTEWQWIRPGQPPQRLLEGFGDPTVLASDPQGDRVAVGSDRQVTVLRLPTGGTVQRSHTMQAQGRVQAIVWSSSTSVVTLSGVGVQNPNALELWQLPPNGDASLLSTTPLAFSSSAIDIDREGGLIVVANDLQLVRYRLTKGAIEPKPVAFRGTNTSGGTVLSVPAHSQRIDDVAIAGRRVYSVSQFELRVWDLDAVRELLVRVRPLRSGAMVRVDATAEGWVLLSGPTGAELWDLSGLSSE